MGPRYWPLVTHCVRLVESTPGMDTIPHFPLLIPGGAAGAKTT
jgi:hypothetical protein